MIIIKELDLQKYWVEGTFLTKQAFQRAKKIGRVTPQDVEPFSMAFWASSPEEAIRMAREKLDQGDWVEGPAIVKQSEEERMRTMGAPELPGFAPVQKKRKS
ncbi:MAG: hypothetical protein MUO64_22375 [Anaerolineales bacterium]|jgi:hypothetical protein|nr:hypothetical protein [Anaerolineales bacterium]